MYLALAISVFIAVQIYGRYKKAKRKKRLKKIMDKYRKDDIKLMIRRERDERIKDGNRV